MGVFARDKDIFDAKLSIRAFAGIVWLFTSSLHLSADKASLIRGVGNRVIRHIFQQLASFFVPLIDKLNGSLVLGGIGEDIELDEISFRSVGRRFGIVWLRFLAVVCRGSSLVWIHRLPYRITQAGQGGGGPLSVDEMREALLLDSDEPVLGEGFVCHTDGAKAYRNLAGALYNGSLKDFECLKLGHTCVKHKPPTLSLQRFFPRVFGRVLSSKNNRVGAAPET